MSKVVPVTTQLFYEPASTSGPWMPEKVDARDPSTHSADCGSAISFRYYEQEVVEFNGQELRGPKVYDGGKYYRGTYRTIAEHTADMPEAKAQIVRSNAQQEGAEYVVVRSDVQAFFVTRNDFIVSLQGVVTRVRDLPAADVLKI